MYGMYDMLRKICMICMCDMYAHEGMLMKVCIYDMWNQN